MWKAPQPFSEPESLHFHSNLHKINEINELIIHLLKLNNEAMKLFAHVIGQTTPEDMLNCGIRFIQCCGMNNLFRNTVVSFISIIVIHYGCSYQYLFIFYIILYYALPCLTVLCCGVSSDVGLSCGNYFFTKQITLHTK